MQGWIDLLRSLGEALLEVWRAEFATLQGDLERSGRHLGIALAYLGAAAVLFFWIVGLVLFVLVAVLHIWLEWWAAALIVLALFLAGAALLGWLGWRQARQVENPVATVRRRVDNHFDWWQHGLLSRPQTLDVEPASSGVGDPFRERDLP